MNQLSSLSPVRKLTVAALLVAAAGFLIQIVSGVEAPTVPLGLVILLAAAAVVALLPWRWIPMVRGRGAVSAPRVLRERRRGQPVRPEPVRCPRGRMGSVPGSDRRSHRDRRHHPKLPGTRKSADARAPMSSARAAQSGTGRRVNKEVAS
jgi:hypothetical protein